MRIFSVPQSVIAKLRTRLLLRLLVVGVLVLMGSILCDFINKVSLLGIGMLSIPSGFALLIYYTVRYYDEIWKSIRIEVGDNYVVRYQKDAAPIRVNRDEITSLDEIQSELYLRTADKFQILVIPKELDSSDFQQIKQTLSSWIAAKS